MYTISWIRLPGIKSPRLMRLSGDHDLFQVSWIRDNDISRSVKTPIPTKKSDAAIQSIVSKAR